MSITPSEDLLNTAAKANEAGQLFKYLESMAMRLKLEGCFSDFDNVNKTLSVLFNGHIIGVAPITDRHLAYFEALKFIVARERLKGNHVQH